MTETIEPSSAHGTPDEAHPRTIERDGTGGSSLPPGMGKRLALLICGAFLLGVVMTLIVLWVTSFYLTDEPITGAPFIAALIGGGASMAVAAGLMAVLFHSDRSRWDEDVKNATKRR